ncbi:D-lactate dehydrogenase (cytochrome) [Methylocella silvestris BL2]|uniref:D-2-hydroxyglutarate dehydrogenase n=1 Tax=Methylocella silvestris (strain DSM 15510 / CIP 108128 / LMG 27833 / NCIMB 13906 / BL2) TaxID=395965 RepID=B8ES86_METSB|nr:FAD-binding and (Fe-S)-binding domain-containing protein [Methylocella silvestris]ACK52301.1 D-lactate dehydrogenase (cytochrome) [Methylocella silvestris BL2]
MVGATRSGFEGRLRAEIAGDILFDAFSRGRYATDASHYQMIPLGVAVPKTVEAAVRAFALAREEGVPVTARGGGTSQCGQTINRGLVIDGSKYLRRILSLDVAGRRCVVEPGIVLDDLNRQLKPHGLWFPVDVSTASRATIGGMTANNSCGGRSLRYGTTRDNVISIEAVLADGAAAHFGETATDLSELRDAHLKQFAEKLLAIGAREADEVAERFPKVQRRVGGYNIDALDPARGRVNFAHILVGSEGTLAYSTAIELKLSPLLGRRAVGVCHFGSFHAAMNSAQHIVKLEPIAVELVDATMISLASEIPMFRPTLDAVVRGEPQALLLVEFAEDDAENVRRLKQLGDLMGDLGFGFDREGAHWGGVVETLDPSLQADITDLRTSGLNIMMSMKDEAKPISFVEDCAVPLEHLADYTEKLTSVFEKHGTRGTWYAHASEGCLHVRPVLNLRLDKDVKAMRAIAEEAFALVRAYKGSHSGEHGDGLVRSEFHEPMFGQRLVKAFEEVKSVFDPKGILNPGKIVRSPRFDDRSLLRYAPGYEVRDFAPQLSWAGYPGAVGGLQGAVEMCNNNGACRKLEGGAMCPSYRATRDEKHVTRGRANSLRLALSGQLGADAFASDAMAETMKLCVSCKACKRECPTSVDMARMKIEVMAARAQKHGFSLRDRLIAYMPRYAPFAARLAPLLNLRNRSPFLRRLMETIVGFSARRDLPIWRPDRFSARAQTLGPVDGRELVLWVDSFNAAFEPENIEAAITTLTAAGYRVHIAGPIDGSARPLCCGRTFLSIGNVAAARAEMSRTLTALRPFLERGLAVVGLEPSCLFSFRDEALALLPGEDARRVAAHAMLFEEFIVCEAKAGRFPPVLGPVGKKALLHGHCHQKAFGAMGAVETALRLVPGLTVETIESSCCGMAGAFGYQAETMDVSLAMAELSLLPAVRKAELDALLVADGTSCRHQIRDGAPRKAVHVARLFEASLKAGQRTATKAKAAVQ